MTLQPGGTTDDQPSNEHPHSEQWLLVLSGRGQAVIGEGRAFRRVSLRENSLLIIEKGALHQIKNTGRKLLRTFNLYVPPAYKVNGKPRWPPSMTKKLSNARCALFATTQVRICPAATPWCGPRKSQSGWFGTPVGIFVVRNIAPSPPSARVSLFSIYLSAIGGLGHGVCKRHVS
jgi:hypothetical protein